MGAVDQEPRRRPPDAALAHRQDRRHPVVQERPLAERRADRHHRALGRCRRAEGRPEGHAAAGEVGGRQRLELRADLRRAAGPRRQVAGLHAEGNGAGRVVQAGRRDRPHRGALGSRDRDSARHRQGPQDHPSRAGAPAADRKRQQRRAAAGGRRRRSGSGPLHGVGGRQAGRNHAPGFRQADAARLEDRVGHPLLTRSAKTSPTHVELGIYFYPKGQEPKYPPDAGALQRHHRRQPQPRHPAELGLRRHQLPRDAQGRPRRELPAAHAPARQGDVDGSHPADRPDADAEHGQRLQLQLAQQLRLRRRRGAAAAQGHDPQDHLVARQHRPPTRTTPIRTSGWAGAIAPSTRWRTPG